MRIDVLVSSSTLAAFYTGGGFNYIVQTNSGVLYCFFINASTDPAFKKSTDYGITWNTEVVLANITCTTLSVWFDRWSGINADLIHVIYADQTADNIFYRNINTASGDALSSQTIVFDGASTAAGGSMSITRARGGNLMVAGSIDAGTEDGAWKSTDVGANWAACADPSEASTQDEYLLVPGWNADNQDVMLIFWDASADEISVKRYDDSANSWAETSIATSMVDTPPVTSFPHMSAAVDLKNSRIIFAAWTAVSTLNADLRCWRIDDTTITEGTNNIVLNSVLNQGFSALGIDTQNSLLYALYCGKSDGTEISYTTSNIYYKTSSDYGDTWGSETKLTEYAKINNSLLTAPRFIPPLYAVSHSNSSGVFINIPITTGGGNSLIHGMVD